MIKSVYKIIISITIYIFTSCAALEPSADLAYYTPYFSTDIPCDSGYKVTFLGTSTLVFDDGKTQILVDGFVSRPSLIRVGLLKVKPNIRRLQYIQKKHGLNRVKAILVCHAHYDHAMDAPWWAKATGASIIGSSSTGFIAQGGGVPTSQFIKIISDSTIQIGDFKITPITSKHTPPFQILGKTNAVDPEHPELTGPLIPPVKADDYPEGGTYDFYIQHGAHASMVKASTNFIPGALQKYKTDVFFLGTAMLGVQNQQFMQAYWQHTIQATQAHTVVPIHWDYFFGSLKKPLKPLPNAIDNVQAGFDFLREKAHQQGVRFTLMDAHHTLNLKCN